MSRLKLDLIGCSLTTHVIFSSWSSGSIRSHTCHTLQEAVRAELRIKGGTSYIHWIDRRLRLRLWVICFIHRSLPSSLILEHQRCSVVPCHTPHIHTQNVPIFVWLPLGMIGLIWLEIVRQLLGCVRNYNLCRRLLGWCCLTLFSLFDIWILIRLILIN